MVKFVAALMLTIAAMSVALVSDSDATTLRESSKGLQCMPSAESVKHAFPGSWPSWSKREAGHKGKKCWFAATTRKEFPEGGSKHDKKIVVHDEAPRKVKTEVVHVQSSNARLASAMSAIVWPRADSFNDRFGASFNDRFDTETTNRPSSIQRLMDPVGVVP
jgi:hypothetical protein